jgi:hypothetical protein
MERRLRFTRRRVATATILLGLVSAGVAYAAIPDGNGVFTACKLNVTGTIRLIDPSISGALGHCSTSLETQISWNQKGPKGDPGAAGAAGVKGDRGPQGLPGPQGDPGPNEVADGAPCSIPGVTNGVLRITTNLDTTLAMRCVDAAAEGDPIPLIEVTNPALLTTRELARVATVHISRPIATDIRVQVQSGDPNVLSVVEDATIPAGHTSSNIIGLPKQANTNVTLTVTFAIGGPLGQAIHVPIRTGPF